MDLSERLLAERRARLAAERMLELKSRELFAANRKLADHARALSEEIVIQRRVVADATHAAEALRGENAKVRSDLHVATEARTVAEHRLWLALETIRDGFAIYDSRGHLVVANAAYLSPFEGLEEVGPGAHVRDILRIGLEEGVFDPEGQSHADWIAAILRRWSDETIAPHVLRLWDGGYIRLIDRRGTDGGIVSLALNITDEVYRERQLDDARTRAEAANRAKSAFLANMSHELRTPMNGVVAMAELLCETPLNDEQMLYARTIKSSGEALLHIINDVLDFSKLEAERMVLRHEPFDLERKILEIVTLLSPSAAEKGLTLAVDIDPSLPTQLMGDRGRVRQVLTNLIGNAVKFTHAGHVLMTVRVTDSPAGKVALAIAVEDSGIGIPPDRQEHVFGEFNQVEDERNRKYEGTGLGLSISRRLVRLMGGDIELTSKPGLGSRFTVTASFDLAPGSEVPTLPDGTGKRVLLRLPDPIQRSTLGRQLEAAGFTLLREASGRQDPDLAILADAAWQEDGTLPACPVVVVTGLGSGARRVDAPKVVATAAWPGPRHELYAALTAALHQAESPSPPKPDAAESPRRARVVAAEDNRTNQLVFQKMLKDLSLDITVAGNGREAVEAFLALRPDLIFMDISMPEMDGREATQVIRAEEARLGLPRTPIVALTAHALVGDAEELLAAGMDLYLTKPLKKADILAAIGKFAPHALCPGTARAVEAA